ncbi:hypothetical protein D1007_03979 [Hordeum vulgare]|nr:hypothetical protein D1007_03979 [Hordeum vulgare]
MSVLSALPLCRQTHNHWTGTNIAWPAGIQSEMVMDGRVRLTTSRSSMARMTRSNPRPTIDEHPLTEYEKVRARNMLRNNRIFQSLGIGAIASMIRKRNDVQEGRTNEVQEGSVVINDDPEDNPKEDEVVVHKTVKELKESRAKRPGVKKTTSKKRKSSEASAAMPPGKANFEMNTDSETIKYACKDVLQKSSKNRHHKIKKKYLDTAAANKVSTKSPVPDLTDGEWQALVQMWSTPRHKKEEHQGEEVSAIDLFKATYNSKKHGFSEPVKIPIKLERSELQAEVMQEEMAGIKLKAEEYKVARDKELELLRKKSQEQEEKLAHLMALFSAKAS